MRDLIESAARLGALALAALALGLGFGERAIALDLVVPGEVGMVFIGAASRAGDAPLTLVIAASVLGAVAGDSFGYFIGRRWGTTVLYRWNWLRRRVERSVERSRTYLARRGGVAVFVARWVGRSNARRAVRRPPPSRQRSRGKELKSGGDDGTRTHDALLAKDARRFVITADWHETPCHHTFSVPVQFSLLPVVSERLAGRVRERGGPSMWWTRQLHHSRGRQPPRAMLCQYRTTRVG
jgi:SNARE associated Golgi protein